MTSFGKQGERFIVMEATSGRTPFSVDLSESFSTADAAAEFAKTMTVPGGSPLVVIGLRFCATIVPPARVLKDRGHGSPFLPDAKPALPIAKRAYALSEYIDGDQIAVSQLDDGEK